MMQCTIRGKQLSYVDVGVGPAVLFGHSYLWNNKMWDKQVEKLSQTHRCILPDLWAHGDSDTPPSTPVSLDDLANDHWQLMQHLGIDRFSIVGTSIGGMWGMRMTLAHPEAVAKLVLIGTDGGAEPEASRQQYLGLLAAIESAGCIPPPIIDKVAPGFLSPTTIKNQPEIYEAFCRLLRTTPADRIPGVAAMGRAFVERSNVLDQLTTIDTPTFIIVGAEDAYRPPHESEQLATKISGSHLEVMKSVGHLPAVEQADMVSAMLADFLV